MSEAIPEAGFARLERAIAPARARVLEHALYTRVGDVAALRVFMRNHVFAVWAFMSVLKILQRRLTCVEVPWLLPADTVAARLVNEIVLGEETDEVAPGRFLSHFELYLEAMREVGAETRGITDFVAALRSGQSPEAALETADALPATKRFVLEDLALAERPTHEVAAAFLLGREDLVPAMFERIIGRLRPTGLRAESFERYLVRHLHVDTEQHGPMARRILDRIGGDDERRWSEAAAAAERAIRGRERLWDGILEAVVGVERARASGSLAARAAIDGGFDHRFERHRTTPGARGDRRSTEGRERARAATAIDCGGEDRRDEVQRTDHPTSCRSKPRPPLRA